MIKVLFQLLIVSLLAPTVNANENNSSTLIFADSSNELTLSGNLTLFSATNQQYNQLFVIADLMADISTASGKWYVFIEANSTPNKINQENDSDDFWSTANARLGSATDSKDKGRMQLSELHYTWYTDSGTLTTGLLDIVAFLDNSEIAENEVEQFLSSSFVSNPTIALPEYSLASAYHLLATTEHIGLKVLIAASEGLTDSSNKTYSELFKLKKGAFAAIEPYWQSKQLTTRLGLWGSTANSEHLSSETETEHNYGAYVVIDGVSSNFIWNIRAGIANRQAFETSKFISAAVEIPFGADVFAIAIAQTWQPKEQSSLETKINHQAELYYRLNANKHLQITPSIQYIESIDKTKTNNLIYGLRMNWHF